MAEWGMLSLAPMFAALVIEFRTKSAAFALLAGCITGVILLGLNPTSGLRELFQRVLGNGAFISSQSHRLPSEHPLRVIKRNRCHR